MKNRTTPRLNPPQRGGLFNCFTEKANRLCLILLFLFVTHGLHAANINVNVGLPPDTAGSCRENVYSLTFTNVTAAATVKIKPALIGGGACSGGNATGVFMTAASVPAGITILNSGDSLVFTVNANVTLTYHCYVDCRISGISGVQLNQNFTSSGNTINNVTTFTHTTTGLLSPVINLQPQLNQTALFNSNSYLTFKYINTLNRGSIRFTFNADSTYCGQITTDSIFFKRGVNDTLHKYTNTAADTVTLFTSDTLYVLQRVKATACNTNSCSVIATLQWQCNFPALASAALCSNCANPAAATYEINNNDSAAVNVLRYSPVSSTYELSCFNDTADAPEWSYAIVHTGRGVIDSLKFELAQYGSTSTGDINFLSLMKKSSLAFAKGVNDTFSLDTTLTLKTAWLCATLVDTAVHSCKVLARNFGFGDTLFVKFKTLRCTQDTLALNNTPKIWNRWFFKDFYTKDICNRRKDQQGTGLYNNGTFISGQSNGSTFYDMNLKLHHFPTVSNMSVNNQGVGDTAIFTVDLKTLVDNANLNVYQLLGCMDPLPQCDTLHGWLRTTILLDTNLRIPSPAQDVKLYAVDANNDTTFITQHYYNTDLPIGDSVCRRTFYQMYFNLADTGMRRVFENGKLEFKLEACCGADVPYAPYRVSFDLLPDPDNCFTLTYTGAPYTTHLTAPALTPPNIIEWLPLSSKQNREAVQCVGCKSPGFLSDFYTMRRTTLGLQDSDNNGYSDSLTAQIRENTPWYNQYGSLVNRNVSAFGDRVEDLLKGYFVDGDPTNGGYNYQQLTQRGLRFNVLQLSRVIPLGLDTMKLTPDSIIFYVDDNVPSANGCLDCQPYGMSSSNYTTRIKVTATGAALTNYLLNQSVADNEYRFAFTTYYDSVSNQYSGNLHNAALVYTPNTSNPFTGFETYQVCRLRVTYNICGNYQMPTTNPQIDDVVKQSTIRNNFFFSGKVKNLLGDNIQQQPNTEQELEDADYTVYMDSVGGSIQMVDTNFMNTYRFYCENTGANHYFASTRTGNASRIINTAGCNKQMNVNAESNIAGGKGVYDVFPYEYKIPLLQPVEYNLTIPTGYYVQNASVRNGISTGGVTVYSDTVRVQLPDSTGNVVFNATVLPPLTCLTENNTVAGNDTLFAGDQNNRYELRLLLAPIDCPDSITQPLATNTATLAFNVRQASCMTAATCGAGANDTLRPSPTQLDALSNIPQFDFTNNGAAIVPLGSDTICFNSLRFENLNTGQTGSIAEHVFIALIDTPAYLRDWFFSASTDTSHSLQSILAVNNGLAKGQSITGNLCARVTGCPRDTLPVSINIHCGWNCDGYPVPYDSTAVCYYEPQILTFKKQGTDLVNAQKFHRTSYSLCDTVSVWAPFSSTQQGNVYPDSVVLQNLNPALEVVGAFMVNGGAFSGNSAALTPTGTNAVWLTSIDSIRHIQFTEGGLSASQTMYIRFLVRPTCNYLQGGQLPDMALYAHDFCGEFLGDTAAYSGSGPFAWDSTSKCNDCFSVDKIANKDTVAVGDTVTFTITVCSHNGGSQSIALFEQLPDTSVFTFISSTPTFPYFMSFAADTCLSYTVKGKYKTVGSCPSPLLQNKVTLQASGGATFVDSVCVNVSLPCYSPGTLVWGNNTYTDPSLLASYSGQNIIIQDTLYVNDSLFLGNCHVYTYAGAQIIVTATGRLVLDNTIVEGCTNMWRGTLLYSGAKLWVKQNSVLADANHGIEARNGSSYSITNSSIKDCIRSIYTPALSAGNNIATTIFGSKFGLYRSAFKPDYPGQTAHDTIPRAGIEVYDVVMYINSPYSYMYNEFRNVNWGIYGVRSKISVEKCRFRKIYKSGYYGSATHKGSAIAMEGAISKPCELIFKDVGIGVANATIDTCVYGVYTEYTNLFIDSVNMRNVKTNGINVLRCNQSNGTSDILHSEIVASNKGVNFSNCNTGKRMRVSNCYINVNGGSKCKAVDIENTIVNSNGCVYLVDSNAIETFSGSGITGTIARNVRAYYNQVFMSLSKGSGIDLNSCDSAHVSCNYVYGHYPLQNNAAYNGKAIAVNISSYGFVSCNQMDSTWHGVEFNGSCLPTDFRGNEIQTHNIGLYLNNVAVIDTQSHAGNRWWGNYTVPPFSGYGAWNENDSTPAKLTQSLFIVDPGLDTTFNPRIPFGLSGTPNDQGWFDPQVNGNTYDCIGDNYCHVLDMEGEGSQGIMEAIASDESLSGEFVDETKSMAKATVFEMLKADSLQYADNEVLMDFMAATETENIGLLYNVEQALAEADDLTSIAQTSNNNADSLIKWHSHSIYILDSLAQKDSAFSDLAARQAHIDAIAGLELNKENLISQSSFTSLLAIASSINAVVYNGELPEQNEKTLNEIEIIYQTQGLSGIEPYYTTLLSIANQCPFSAGPAVYRARAFVSLFDETLEYYDSDVCFQEGYYRKGKNINQSTENDELKVIPNPAKDKLEVVISAKLDGISSVIIEEMSGKVVLQKQLDCKNKQNQIDISYLSQGIYTIKVFVSGTKVLLQKIVVIR